MSISTMKTRAAVGGVAACLALAACGGSSGQTSETDNGLTQIDVGIIPLTSVGALMLGIEQGFFSDEGLDVETHTAQSGAALVPAVASGQYQFAFSNNMSLVAAHGRNLPVRIVRSANSADSDPAPNQEALVVNEGSGIDSLQDLEGETIATNSLNNTPHLAVLTALEEAGVDTSTVEFVEVGYPDMPLALEQNQVTAADISEPTLTLAKEQGMKELAYPYRVLKQDLHLSSWFTTQSFIDQDPEVVESFARAIDKSNAYARDNTDEVRAHVPSYMEIESDLAERMAMPRYPDGGPGLETLQMLADGAERYGFMDSASTDIDQLMASIN